MLRCLTTQILSYSNALILIQQMLSLQDAYMLRCSLLKCCSNAPMLWCLVTLMVCYSNALFFYKCSSSHRCSNAQMLRCFDARMLRCFDLQMLRFLDAQLLMLQCMMFKHKHIMFFKCSNTSEPNFSLHRGLAKGIPKCSNALANPFNRQNFVTEVPQQELFFTH